MSGASYQSCEKYFDASASSSYILTSIYDI
jgi:hypothetical protein